MKVLHVIPSISRIRGGPSQAIFEMVDALRKGGVDATIATTNDNANSTKLEIPLNQRYDYALSQGRTVPVYCFDRYESRYGAVHEYTFSKGLTQFLWDSVRDYDLVHIHAIFSYPSAIAMAIANFYRVPYIIRPLGSLCTWSLEQSRTQKQIYLKLMRRFLDQSSGIHFTAAQEAQEVSRLQLKSPRFIIPLGLNSQPFQPKPQDDLRAQYNITNSDPILLFLSRLHPKKGIEILLEALDSLPHRFNLIIAGSGAKDYELKIQHLVGEKHWHGQVRFVGFVEGEPKQQLLTQADLFVLTSYSENFGIVVLEALAAGTPTLVTPGVALAPLVQEHDVGWVCELTPQAIGQTLETALADSNKLTQKGQRAKSLVQTDFSWRAIAQKLTEQYHQVILASHHRPQFYSSVTENA